MSFSMVDKKIESDSKYIKTLKMLSISEAVYEIHFPYYPVLPAVLLLENIKQSAEMFLNEWEKKEQRICFIYNVEKLKIFKPVFPGDVIYTELSLLNRIDNICCFDAKINNQMGKIAICKNVCIQIQESGDENEE